MRCGGGSHSGTPGAGTALANVSIGRMRGMDALQSPARLARDTPVASSRVAGRWSLPAPPRAIAGLFIEAVAVMVTTSAPGRPWILAGGLGPYLPATASRS